MNLKTLLIALAPVLLIGCLVENNDNNSNQTSPFTNHLKNNNLSGIYYDVKEEFTRNDTVFHVGLCYAEEVESYINKHYEPIYEPLDDFVKEIGNSSEQKLNNPGKIYQYNQYQFIAEIEKGIHVYDNSDPSSPEHLTFIQLPGNADIAIQEDILYADTYGALLALDFKNPENIEFLSILPETLEPTYEMGFEKLTSEGHLKEVKVIEGMTHLHCGYYYDIMDDRSIIVSGSDDNDVVAIENPNNGEGGSLARFALTENHLYAITSSELVTFDITKRKDPEYKNRLYATWGAETIIFENRYLFVGSQSAMQIYNIDNPNQPEFTSELWHATSCDPVVVQGDFAYVTLKSGNRCRNGDNELEVIDISNIFEPKLVKTIPMEGPSGLGVHKTELYVSDASNGLIVFNITYSPQLEKINQIETIEVEDVIVNDENLTLIGDEGMYQYDHSDPRNLILQSFIPAVK